MTRRVNTITIEREGRDKGKSFSITEMPAAQAEEWCVRAIMLLIRSGAEVPVGLLDHGWSGFATMGLGSILAGIGKAPFGEVRPLLDELMGCVAFVSPSGVTITDRTQVSGQIEEVATRMQLRQAVLELHLGFSIAASLSGFRGMVAAMVATGQPTETSPEQSE